LLIELSQTLGGKLNYDKDEEPATWAILGTDTPTFERNFAALQGALLNRIKDRDETNLAFEIIGSAYANFVWKREVEKLEKEDRPRSEWPPKPPSGPDFRNWYMIWMIPSIGVLVSLLIFLAFFHLKPPTQVPAVGASKFAPSGGAALDTEGIVANREGVSSPAPDPAALTKPHDPPGP
jgi:hypothetical protein